MTPIRIEVVIPLITAIEFKCSRCGPLVNDLEARKRYLSDCENEYPEDWKRDAARLGDCLQKISEIY